MIENCFKTEFIRQHTTNKARILRVTTPHGTFTTPTFMPVGTRAVVNFLLPEQLQQTGSKIILGGNTYHMLVQPGMEVIQNAGGMHAFMNWQQPMLTDSGGYQVLSLSQNKQICKIKEDGAHFKHPTSGEVLHLTPQSSIAAQKIIGADIIMAFDQCTPDSTDPSVTAEAMERSHRWLLISKETHTKNPCSVYGAKQAFFAIVQGGYNRDLRLQCLEQVLSVEPDGIAIGGEIIGYDMEKTCEILQWLHPYLPQDQVHYTMGVGLEPQNLLDAVAQGADVFDCVAPTRNARHGALYCGRIVIENNWPRFEAIEERTRILIKRSIYAKDVGPIMPECDCYTCQHFGRDYLHFLFKSNSNAFMNLACIHNVRVMQRTCEAMQQCILAEK